MFPAILYPYPFRRTTLSQNGFMACGIPTGSTTTLTRDAFHHVFSSSNGHERRHHRRNDNKDKDTTRTTSTAVALTTMTTPRLPPQQLLHQQLHPHHRTRRRRRLSRSQGALFCRNMPLSTVILLAVLIADLFWRDSFRRLFGSSSNTLVEDMQQLENTLLASSTTMKSMSALESVLAATNGNDNKHVSRDDNDIMLPARQLCPNTARLFPSRTNLRAFVKGRIDYYQNGVGLQKVSAQLN